MPRFMRCKVIRYLISNQYIRVSYSLCSDFILNDIFPTKFPRNCAETIPLLIFNEYTFVTDFIICNNIINYLKLQNNY